MMTDQVEAVELETCRTAVVSGHASVGEIPAFVGGAFAEVMGTLSAQGLAPSGPPFSRYRPTEEGFDVEAGFPTTDTVSPAGRVNAGNLPGGTVARVVHKGSYSDVPSAYEAAAQWASAHGFVPAGPPWESYLDSPEVKEPRTVICMPLAQRRNAKP